MDVEQARRIADGRATEEQIKPYLNVLEPDMHRKEWFTVLAALKHELGETGWPLALRWSQGYETKNYGGPSDVDNYRSEEDVRRTWDFIQPLGKRSAKFKTLVRMASHETYFDVRGLDGRVVARHYRTDDPVSGKKSFRWETNRGERRLPEGYKRSNSLPLFGSELLAKASPGASIIVTEGESTALHLRTYLQQHPPGIEVAVLATVTGANVCPTVEVLGCLNGRLVYLWPDADEQGAAHMEELASRLDDELYIINWPDAKPKDDAKDWIAAGAVPCFEELLNGAALWERKERKKKPKPRVSKEESVKTLEQDVIIGGKPRVVADDCRREAWSTEATTALVAASRANERCGLYGTTRISAEKGESMGDVVHLSSVPAQIGSTRDHQLAITTASPGSICARLDSFTAWHVMVKNNGSYDLALGCPTRREAQDVIERYRIMCLNGAIKPLYPLRGVVDSPVLRYDGSLLDTPGYDLSSGLYADFAEEDWKGFPKKPNRDDARAGLRTLLDLVKETPFATEVDASVWVAFLLTLMARPYAQGNIPLFGFDANAAGSGKTTLVDLASTIALGHIAAKWAPIGGKAMQADEEERKRFMSAALSGTRIICVDNCVRALGSDAMQMVLTSGTDEQVGYIQDRVLGESKESRAQWTAVLCATGNNLTVRGDLWRRTLMCRLHVQESPENKVYGHHPMVCDYARKNRKELLYAGMRILVAYRDSSEELALSPFPSFSVWSERIRAAIIWAGGADCHLTNARVKEEHQPEEENVIAFLRAWWERWGDDAITVREIADDINIEPEGDVAETSKELPIAPPRGKDVINARGLGTWLRRNKEMAGRPYVIRSGSRARTWYLTEAE